MKNKKLPKYGFGAVLQGVSPFLNLIPGIGQVASLAAAGIGGIMESEEQKKLAAKQNMKYSPVNVTTDPYGMRNGGTIEKGNMKQYSAPTHEEGGQPIDAKGNVNTVNPVAEIEGKENKYKYSSVDNKSYVFSDKNGTSQMIRDVMNRYKNKNVQGDFDSKNGMELEIKQVEALNEKIKALNEQKQQVEMSGGGGLNVITLRKEAAAQNKLGDGDELGVPTGIPFQMGLTPNSTRYQPLLNPLGARIPKSIPLTKPNLNSLETNSSMAFPRFNLSQGNFADIIKTGLTAFDTIRAMTAKPDKVDPRLTNYEKADEKMYSQSVDNTAINNAAQQAANQAYSQINEGTSSSATRMSRLQGVNANAQKNMIDATMNANQMRNSINQNLGQFESMKAQDKAGKLAVADEKFAMNEAATRRLTDIARQTVTSFAQDLQNKQNAKDQFEQAINNAKFKSADAMQALSVMSNNFKLTGLKEYQDWISNPSDENLEKFRLAAQIKIK